MAPEGVSLGTKTTRPPGTSPEAAARCSRSAAYSIPVACIGAGPLAQTPVTPLRPLGQVRTLWGCSNLFLTVGASTSRPRTLRGRTPLRCQLPGGAPCEYPSMEAVVWNMNHRTDSWHGLTRLDADV